MASTIVNVTLLKVIEELENILEIDLDQSDQKALNDPELRQKLIAFEFITFSRERKNIIFLILTRTLSQCTTT
jgi:hypothetical protein